MSLCDRMKTYERVCDYRLTNRMPVIIRVDGRSFHTWTKKQHLERPFDDRFRSIMADAALAICDNVSTSVFSYTQSDEISVILFNYNKFESQPYCDNRIQKLVSHAASIASSTLTMSYGVMTIFDARAFVLPESEVVNYFIERQQDCIRNSIQMVGQSKFSQKQLHGKSCPEIQEMLFSQHAINWSKLPTDKKRGMCIRRIRDSSEEMGSFVRVVDTPEFKNDRSFIDDLLVPEDK